MRVSFSLAMNFVYFCATWEALYGAAKSVISYSSSGLATRLMLVLEETFFRRTLFSPLFLLTRK